MFPVSARGAIALVAWAFLLGGIAVLLLRGRRIPKLQASRFRWLALGTGPLAVLVAWPTSAPLFPIVLGENWLWHPLLFTAGLLAILTFGTLPGLGYTAAISLVAAWAHQQRLSLPLEYGTLLVMWILAAYMWRRYGPRQRMAYLWASLMTGLVSVLILAVSDLIWALDFAMGWATLMEIGRTLILVRFPLRFLEILLAGGIIQALHGLWQRKWGVDYDQAFWQPLRREPPLHHLFLAMALPLGLVLWFILGLFAMQMVEQQMRTQIQVQLANIARDIDHQVTFLMESGQLEVESFAQRSWPETSDEEQLQGYIQQLLQDSRLFHELLLVDLEGRMLARASKPDTPEVPFTPREQSLIQLFRRTPSLSYTELVETPALETSYISFAARLATQPERILLGRVWLNLTPIMEPVLQDLEYIQERLNGRGFLLDADGHPLILDPSDRSFLDLLQFEILPELEELSLDQMATEPQWLQLADRHWFVVFFHPIPGYSWNVVVLIPLQHLHQLAGQLGESLLVWSAAVWLLVLLMGLFVLSRVTASLRELSREAYRLSQGDLDRPLPPGGIAEVRLLRISFEHMRQNLKRRLDELQQLLDVGKRLVATLDWNTVVQPVLKGALYLPEATAARVALMADFYPADLQTTTQRFFGQGPHHLRLAPLDELLLSRLTKEDYRIEPLTQVWNVQTPPPWQDDPALAQAHVLILPLWHQEQPMGVFYVLFQRPPTQKEALLRYYRALSEQLRLALSSARLFAQAVTERQRLEAILWSTPDAIFMTDNNLQVVLANLSACRLLGWPEEPEAYPRDFDVPFAKQEWMDMLLTTTDTPQSREITAPDGRVFFATVAPVRVGQRQVGFVGILRDITHLKEAEAARVDFMAGISHDLRSPLAVIQGYASMLTRARNLTEKQRDYLQGILLAVHQITTMVDNLLELSRMDRGMVEPYFEKIPIRETVTNILRGHQIQARKKKLRLKADIHPDTPPFLEADINLFQRALQNLVDNAIKFTPEGGRVTLRVMPKGHGRLLIVVEDTGMGIAPADRERLFERFYQAENVRKLGLGGKGLGLAIVKSVVEMHHGLIWVESQVGQGSRFYIELPLRQPGRQPEPSSAPPEA